MKAMDIRPGQYILHGGDTYRAVDHGREFVSVTSGRKLLLGPLVEVKVASTLDALQYGDKPKVVPDGRSYDRLVADWRSPTGFWAAEWDGEQEVLLTDQDGNFIPVND